MNYNKSDEIVYSSVKIWHILLLNVIGLCVVWSII
jgi:hypothetical protein